MRARRRPLPVLHVRHEDPATCGTCGGRCCKAMPGIATPEDFGAPDRNAMQVRLREALLTGRWAIDWWEGDPRPDSDALNQAEYVRPAIVGKVGILFDPSWGGACNFLTKDGCELPYEGRPRNCRALVPNFPRSCAEAHDDGERIEKEDYVIAWIPYIGLLDSVAKEVQRARQVDYA